MDSHLITCIVEKGKAERIVEVVLEKGAQAATVFDARGRGVREKIGMVGMFIKPDKEVILIVTREEQTDTIFDTVITMGGLQERGRGFAFIQPVIKSVGFLE